MAVTQQETCNMNQWYIRVSQRMQVMEIPVIGYYWTGGNWGLGKRSSYQSHRSKESPFFVPLKPLIAMAVTFRPQFWDHPHGDCSKHSDYPAGSSFCCFQVRTRSPEGSQTMIISAMHFRNIQTSFSQEAVALIFCESCASFSWGPLIAGRRLRHCIFGSQ